MVTSCEIAALVGDIDNSGRCIIDSGREFGVVQLPTLPLDQVLQVRSRFRLGHLASRCTVFGDFIRRLKETAEGDSNLLDRSMVLMGSHMHSGGHDNRNLPILLAGGSFPHGRHLAFDRDHNRPLANLYVTMLRRLGLEIERFASSTSPMSELE